MLLDRFKVNILHYFSVLNLRKDLPIFYRNDEKPLGFFEFNKQRNIPEINHENAWTDISIKFLNCTCINLNFNI